MFRFRIPCFSQFSHDAKLPEFQQAARSSVYLAERMSRPRIAK
jgi:hypothetical protein